MSKVLEAEVRISGQDRTAKAWSSVVAKAQAAHARLTKVNADLARADKARAMAASHGTMARQTVTAIGQIAGAYIGATAAKDAYVRSADQDRRLSYIGITADAGVEQVAAARAQLYAMAGDMKVPVDGVVAGFETLIATGRSWEEALAFLPSVVATAKASNSEVADIGKTADAVARQMGLAGTAMQAAFDIAAAGGKLGQFELKDQARYLPSILATAKAQGKTGLDGLRDVIAYLQVIRQSTGTSEEAATALSNIFQKMETAETTKKFEEMGVDLPKAMAKARKEGRDLTETFLDLVNTATKGDMSRLPLLIGDAQFLAGIRALSQGRAETERFRAALRGVDGTVLRDVGRLADDARSSIDGLGVAWDRTLKAMATTANASGLTAGLDGIAAQIEEIAAGVERMSRGDVWSGLRDLGRVIGGETPATRAPGLIDGAGLDWSPSPPVPATAVDYSQQRAAIDAGRAEIARLERQRDQPGGAMLPALLDQQLDRARARLAEDVAALSAAITDALPALSTLPTDVPASAFGVVPPADAGDRAAAREEAIRQRRAGYRPGAGVAIPAPAPSDRPSGGGPDAGLINDLSSAIRSALPDGPLKAEITATPQAEVTGPVTAMLEGSANVSVTVRVEGPGTLARTGVVSHGHVSASVAGRSMPHIGTGRQPGV